MVNKKDLLKNFNDDKDLKLQFAKVIDKLNFCSKNYQITFTDFLSVYNSTLFLEYLQKYIRDVNFKKFGGFDESERVIIAFFPDFLQIEDDDFPLSIITIKYNKKYSSSLSHRDFLGAILGLGITRDKLGDIIINQDGVFCFVHKDILEYLLSNLTKVGNTFVSVEKFNDLGYNFNQVTLKEKVITVCSVRLDTVLSSAFNISRAKSLSFIKAKKVFINWSVCSSPSHILSQGDSVTLRGFGKIKINEILGKTKKDKIILNISTTK